MKIIRNPPLQIIGYSIILYSTIFFSTFYFNEYIFLILALAYIALAFFLFKLFFTNKSNHKKTGFIMTLIQAFVFTFLILFPLFHFLIFGTYLDEFFLAGWFAFVSSLIGALISVLVSSFIYFYEEF